MHDLSIDRCSFASKALGQKHLFPKAFPIANKNEILRPPWSLRTTAFALQALILY
jgi:hypothetical protein